MEDSNKNKETPKNILDEIARRHKLFNEKVSEKGNTSETKQIIPESHEDSKSTSGEIDENPQINRKIEQSVSPIQKETEPVKEEIKEPEKVTNHEVDEPVTTNITFLSENNSDQNEPEKEDNPQIIEQIREIIRTSAEIKIVEPEEPIQEAEQESEQELMEPVPLDIENITDPIRSTEDSIRDSTYAIIEEEIEQETKEEIEVENKQEEIIGEEIKPYITDFDQHLFKNGTYYKVFEKFGAHIITNNDVEGVQFTTWAPNAASISVIGEFNGWQDGQYEMNKMNDDGIWTVFIPGLKDGDTYKYSIKTFSNEQLRKSDPYAFRSEMRPKNASVVADISKYIWNDEGWMYKRNSHDYSFKSAPVNIYELHLGSWKRNYDNADYPNEWGYLSYKQLAHDIVDYVKKTGYTHIELMPVMEHPLDISWGYQVTCYYAPTSRFGGPEDFMHFVDYCHQNDIGVILDWVPAHFPSDDFSLGFFDGKQIYGYENMQKGIHKDWGTYIFDYGKPEVQNFLIGSALFWLEKYHADGLRVDAVASMLYLDYSREHGEWEPNVLGGRENLEAIEFLKHLNDIVHNYHKNVMMIAEESTAWPAVSHPVSSGGLGFDMKWNMGWMNDILLYFSKDPVHRKFHQGKITFSLWYAFTENFVLPVSHDEVVHGKKSLLEKMPGDNWQKFANLRLFLGFMTGHPGKKLNFMSTDVAQYNEWNCETQLDWNLLNSELNKKLNLYVKDINELYKNNPALFELDFESQGFQWIDFSDALNSVLSFYRISKDDSEIVLFTFNMTPTVRENYTIGVPMPGFYQEILNSDADIYGGSGIGNMGGKHSDPTMFRDYKHSINVVLPPLAVNIYKWEKRKPDEDMVDIIEDTVTDVEELYVDTDTEGGG